MDFHDFSHKKKHLTLNFLTWLFQASCCCFFPAAIPPPGWEDITWVYSFGHLWYTMTATWCACLGNEGIVASKEQNEAHILNQDLHFCCCGPFFSCLLNVWSSFSSSWQKSRELAGAFKANETVSGKFDHLYSRIRINNQKHLWNPHSRKLRSTKIHGFGFVDVFSFSKLRFFPGSIWSFFFCKNSHLLLIVSPITGVIFRFWGSDDPCSLPLDTQGIWKLNPILEIDVVTRVFFVPKYSF